MKTSHCRLPLLTALMFTLSALQPFSPSAFSQTPGLSGKNEASIRAVLKLVSERQMRPLADGDYTRVSTLDALNAANSPEGIAWSYPWGVTLYGVIRASDFLEDKASLDFVIKHNQIVARDYAFLAAAGDRIGADSDGWKKFLQNRNLVKIGGLMRLGHLDSCGAMGVQMLEAMLRHPGSVTPEQKAVVERVADWVVNKQARLPDGAFWRPRSTDGDRRFNVAPQWPEGTVWIDDLYMGGAFLVRWAQYTGDYKHLSDAARQVISMAARTQDADGVWFHAYSEPLKHRSPVKWGRANGWAMVSAVEVLSAMPDDHPLRPQMLDILRRHIEGIKALQAPTGMWRQVLDDPSLWEETSCTAMFAYCIARAANRGWIPWQNIDHARKAFAAICAGYITPDGRVNGTCRGTNIGQDAAYYANRPRPDDELHGRGVVLLAGAEVLASYDCPNPPATLPGGGLAQHDFLYTGEYDTRKPDQTLFLVRGGKVVFTYRIPIRDANNNLSEFSDMHMLPNGDIVFAYKTGWRKIDRHGNTLHDYQCGKGPDGWNECHTAQPLGDDHVFFMENGSPEAKARIFNLKTGAIEMEHAVPTRKPVDQRSVHGQFRNCRVTAAGTYLIAHMNLGKVIEYDKNWNPVWECDAPSVWHAVRLRNGNTLVSGNQHGTVREVAPSGKTVWELRDGDLPGIRINSVHQARRLANGNTVITNWTARVKKSEWNKIVQLIEVTPDKKVVWAINEWTDPDLGPASCVQILDDSGAGEFCNLEKLPDGFIESLTRPSQSGNAPSCGASAKCDPAQARAEIVTIMRKVADWQLANPHRPPSTKPHRSTLSPAGWVQAAGYTGIVALAQLTNDEHYYEVLRGIAERNEWKPFTRIYDADDHCVSQTYIDLWQKYRDPKMLAPTIERFDYILANPLDISMRFDSVSNPRHRDRWSWCDSLYMAPPAWIKLYMATGNKAYRDFAVTNWWLTSGHLYDNDEHLYFRDDRFIGPDAPREANGKKIFWSRGNGWVMGGLVRVLQTLPADDSARPRFEQQFKEMAAAVLACQQPDGLWRASMLDPASYPLKETSGSGFFCHAFAWGMNNGLLDRATYEKPTLKCWRAMVDCVTPAGKLTHVQPVGYDPKNFPDDSTEAYGSGAFLLAGSEIHKLLGKK
ncbi:glycoside hydrolase family 88/105 protein [Ereboglobus luteus]|nr:glycoside hydrolase family 88 protein [Ereboglobus luteus]